MTVQFKLGLSALLAHMDGIEPDEAKQTLDGFLNVADYPDEIQEPLKAACKDYDASKFAEIAVKVFAGRSADQKGKVESKGDSKEQGIKCSWKQYNFVVKKINEIDKSLLQYVKPLEINGVRYIFVSKRNDKLEDALKVGLKERTYALFLEGLSDVDEKAFQEAHKLLDEHLYGIENQELFALTHFLQNYLTCLILEPTVSKDASIGKHIVEQLIEPLGRSQRIREIYAEYASKPSTKLNNLFDLIKRVWELKTKCPPQYAKSAMIGLIDKEAHFNDFLELSKQLLMMMFFKYRKQLPEQQSKQIGDLLKTPGDVPSLAALSELSDGHVLKSIQRNLTVTSLARIVFIDEVRQERLVKLLGKPG